MVGGFKPLRQHKIGENMDQQISERNLKMTLKFYFWLKCCMLGSTTNDIGDCKTNYFWSLRLLGLALKVYYWRLICSNHVYGIKYVDTIQFIFRVVIGYMTRYSLFSFLIHTHIHTLLHRTQAQILIHSLPLLHRHTLIPSLSLSLSHTHTHTQTHSCSFSRRHIHTHVLSLITRTKD